MLTYRRRFCQSMAMGKSMDIMIDIETLSVSCENSVVLSIAAQQFSLTEDHPVFNDHFVARPPILEQILRCERQVDKSTIQFWGRQNQSIVTSEVFADRCNSVYDCMTHLAEFIKKDDIDSIWANGIVFDLGNLCSLFRQAGVEIPWKYNAPKDARTIYRYLPRVRFLHDGVTDTLKEHVALDDCVFQIWRLWQHWNFSKETA